MSPRDTVLGKIRASMRVPAADSERRNAVSARLADTPRGIIPNRADLPKAGQVELFCAMAAQSGATVSRLGDYAEVPAEVSSYLRARNLPAAIRIGADKRLKKARWDSEKHLEIRQGASDGGDLAGVSHAMAGIAETGTLALVSGQDNPTTINFLPEHHIVLLRSADIKGDMETVWSMLRKSQGQGEMPRALNLITGPSRSGDIEQTILLGAHGPRALHIIVVD
ncbi:lactate utilization protein [Hoeflea sp. YIM 152468]|uniref:LutC/YkgG family protein n=1 Tax=Hoeflea sp. YIM 152468 TaxID=3031759 RepID=UPI0023DCB12C|nr:lactate utilization protein [Hoeflea sp. YIM 152468]MDF1606806.1 lactate utilization protein [Hoeflea sp. YIM 152468]